MPRSGRALLALLALLGLGAAHNCHRGKALGNEEFSVSCGYESKRIEVTVACAGGHSEASWSRFPAVRLDLWNVGTLKFVGCRVPEAVSLRELARSLNLSFVDSLRFEELRSGLSRRNLRGFSVRLLTIVQAAFERLPADVLHDVSDVRHLRIEGTRLGAIPAGFFAGWSAGLQNVSLISNRLRGIGREDLAGLGGLQRLWLTFNEIERIEPGALDGLPSLRLLDLAGNRMRGLPAELFARLASLDSLHLGSNRFDALPAGLLSGIRNCHLLRFRMSRNNGSLATLPGGFFRNLSSLTFVELVHNGFDSLPADLFAGATDLQHLDISENNLSTLPSELFRDTRKLAVLSLIDSQLEYLPDDIFRGLTDLEKLFLNQNRLDNLSSSILEEIDTLKVLEAAWNNLTHIDVDFCEHVKVIEKVDLRGNQLTLEKGSGISVLLNCLFLKELWVSHNKIPQIYSDWLFLNIDVIDLRHNQVSAIQVSQLAVLPHGVTIYLQNNQISTIDLAGLENETEAYRAANEPYPNKGIKVYLGNNPLNCDCRLTDFFRYFENKMSRHVKGYVEIYADMIDSKMGAGFDGFECVSPKELASRSIVDVSSEDLNCPVESSAKDDACSSLCFCREYPERNILSVDCSGRNLTKLPTSVANPRGLAIQLDMSRNKLSQTPSLDGSHGLSLEALGPSNATSLHDHESRLGGSYLSNVTSLDLSGNNISTVTIEVFSKSLRDLRLHNNSISRLDQKVIDYLTEDKALRKLTLHANKWECNCQARHFLGLVQQKLASHELHEITCYGTDRRLSTMTSNELCEGAIAIIVSASLLVAFFGVVIGSMAALYYKYQKEIKVWLYSKQWCLWFVTEDELDRDKKYDAFISFSHKDEDFVEKEIIAKLEEGPSPYKLCLHYRDWLAGEWIPVQISRSVEESRRTVVILSPNFLESVWGRMEFRAAHTQALKEGRARLIVILYGEIGNTDELDPELKSYLSLNTYVKWGDPWFWDKLRYALPHRYEPSKRKSRNARIIENHLAQLPVNNGGSVSAGGKAEVIPMPKLVTSTNDSVKLLDSGAEDERMVASC